MNEIDLIDRQKALALFDFLDSDTPAAINWARNYLRKRGLTIAVEAFNTSSFKYGISDAIACNQLPLHVVADLAGKMKGAWRVNKHRKNKDKVSFSISLDKSVAQQLTIMSKGQKKTEVINMLIQGNFLSFQELKLKEKSLLNEEKRVNKLTKDSQEKKKKTREFVAQPSDSAQIWKVLDEFKSSIDRLSVMLHSVINQDQKCEDPQPLATQAARDLQETLKIHEDSLAIISESALSTVIEGKEEFRTLLTSPSDDLQDKIKNPNIPSNPLELTLGEFNEKQTSELKKIDTDYSHQQFSDSIDGSIPTPTETTEDKLTNTYCQTDSCSESIGSDRCIEASDSNVKYQDTSESPDIKILNPLMPDKIEPEHQ